VVLGTGGVALADGFQFPGLGAEALGRGGAVVADSSDWTSIYWNPSGLARFAGDRGEIGLEGVVSFYISRDNDSLAVSPIFQTHLFPSRVTSHETR
jgi:hypothetical protein